MPARLSRLVWPLLFPVRLYLRRFPLRKGKGFVYRKLVDRFAPAGRAYVACLEKRTLIRLYYGEAISYHAIAFGGFEAAEVRYVTQRARPGTTALDVGANVGVFTVPLARAVGPSGCVLAFEPVPANAARLRENLTLNNVTNVEIHEVAVGDRVGTAVLNIGSDPAYHSFRSVPEHVRTDEEIVVPEETLDLAWDRAGSPPVSVVKIDVEGAELEVLRGGQRMLRACQPSVVLETHDARRNMVTRWFEAHGYGVVHARGFEPWNLAFRPVSSAS